mmetsp:Transcript_105487/g.273104  ORF Transcript_105487/g.273104 Transcript_105487/m.273104 type:complete len:374 (+) Transcript_105487:753-1874(+)
MVSICFCWSRLIRAEISGRRPQHTELGRLARPRLAFFGRRDSFGDIESLDLSRDWLSQKERMVVTVVTALTVCARGSDWPGSTLLLTAWKVLGVGAASSGGMFSSLGFALSSARAAEIGPDTALVPPLPPLPPMMLLLLLLPTQCMSRQWSSGVRRRTSATSVLAATAAMAAPRRELLLPLLLLPPKGKPIAAAAVLLEGEGRAEEFEEMAKECVESLSSSAPPPLSKDGAEDVWANDAGPCKSTVEGDGELKLLTVPPSSPVAWIRGAGRARPGPLPARSIFRCRGASGAFASWLSPSTSSAQDLQLPLAALAEAVGHSNCDNSDCGCTDHTGGAGTLPGSGGAMLPVDGGSGSRCPARYGEGDASFAEVAG